MEAKGRVFKYGDNVDTDVIIPARYLNSFDAKELASHAMVDLDPTFVERVQPGDIIVAKKNFGCGSSREHAPLALKTAGVSCKNTKSFRNALGEVLKKFSKDSKLSDVTVYIDINPQTLI